MEEKPHPIEGVLDFHFETGTEGGYWAFQDKRFITKDESGNERWSYSGLHILHDGDHLIIYDKTNPERMVWSGFIKHIEHPVFTEHIYGMWIHTDQQGVSRKVWAEWFLKEYPAKLVLGMQSRELLKKFPRSH